MNDNIKTYLKHLGLFILTFLTATLAGTWWINGKVWPFTDYEMSDFFLGMQYSIPFLLILTVHEFGHYFMAKYHKIKTTLPFYIPIPPFPGSIGTMGAIIRIKQHIISKKIHFDIGIAGPLAGFVIALGVLIYGYATLPELDYLFEIHPSYAQYGDEYANYVYTPEFQKSEAERLYTEARVQDSLNAVDNGEINKWSFPAFQPDAQLGNLSIGKPLLMQFMETFVSDKKLIPNASEMMHYPLLMAGFLALLVTALNLMPIGQLDGGHVLYGLIGTYWHRRVAAGIFLIFLFYAGYGYITPFDGMEDLMWNVPLYIGFLYITLKGLKRSNQETLMYALIIFTLQFSLPFVLPEFTGYSGWLLFAFIIGRFLGVYHPPVPIEQPLDLNRQILGWLSLLIFIISFSPAPIVIN
ncbi:site-2 protease family protein [Fulvivirga lutimaris]|uniref:site-2 protease family protein n=1 Tax=Fulvivirga lutimaris TaxID=1819566 RepID=UPI0012BCA2BB|nr:site-2 protease family protein [Fulvivirga lutimaris]MTI39657.1 site-2 protease family protein [Fulvivirga lutimaris]